MAADWWVPILIVLVIAIIAIVLSYTAIRFGWYNKLEKPYLYYNGWVYSPIWYLIYGLVMFSWIRLITDPCNNRVGHRILIHVLFLLQLLFMLGWIIELFYYRDITGSMVYLFLSITLLVILILLSISDPLSLFFLILFLSWLLYLLYMTWQLKRLNPV